MDTHDENGFRLLWPILFLQRILPSNEHANLELERLILAQESGHESLTTDYRHANFFTDGNPAISWLKQCVHRSAMEYCQRAGMAYSIDWSLQGWPNINRLGDYHDPHNHPYAYLSGTYYVRVPDQSTPPSSRPDIRPGCITFYDPRGAVNMTAIKNDPQIEPEFTVSPKAGMILLWPSFLMHFVHPNLVERLRISISFNLMVKNPTDYLPQQI